MEQKDLEKMTIKNLREEALKYPDQIEGVNEMDKEELISALRKVPGIQEPTEHQEPGAKRRATKPLRSKAELKKKIQALKEERRQAWEAQDYKAARQLRRRIHILKRLTRKAVTAAG